MAKEIHRMEVRHAELMKRQERLIQAGRAIDPRSIHNPSPRVCMNTHPEGQLK